MQIGSISRNYIFGLILALELGFSVVFYFYYYVPKNAEIMELQAEVEKKKRDVREIEYTKRLLAETKLENERLKTEIEHLEKFFPEEMYIPTVLLQIEHLATATRLNITRIQPGGAKVESVKEMEETTEGAPQTKKQVTPGVVTEEKTEYEFDPEKEYKTAVVTMEVTGTFSAMYNFFNELASFPKLVVVNNFSAMTGQMAQQGALAQTPESMGLLKITLPLTFYIQQKKPTVVLQ